MTTKPDHVVDDFHANFEARTWRNRLPVVRQTELAECGHACLAMIASFFGRDVDLTEIRRIHPVSVRGSRLSALIEMGEKLGLQSRAIRIDLGQVKWLSGPCILHWDESHFVVLKEAKGRAFIIHDPSSGRREIDENELSRHFTGVVLEVRPGATFEKRRATVDRISIRSLFGRVAGLLPALAHIAMLAVALEAATVAVPFLLQWVIDQVLVAGDRQLLLVLAASFSALTLFAATITALRSWAMACLGASLSVQWSGSLFRHLMKLPMSWFDSRHVGDVVFRFGSLQTIQRTMTTQFVATMLDGLMSSAMLVVMMAYNAPLTLLVVGIFSAYTVMRLAFFGQFRSAGEQQIISAARQQTVLLESIRGAMTIKVGNAQRERTLKYVNASVHLANSDIAVQKLSILFTFGDQVIFGIGRVATVYFAARGVLDTHLSTGMLVAFIAYADIFSSRASTLVDRLVDVRMLRLHAERIADIAHADAEEHLVSQNGLNNLQPCIELRNVSFRYRPDDPWVLRNISLRIEAGESVAIVGSSGCGKTTLVKVILGLLQPSEGVVLVGGSDIKTVGLEHYRRMIGSVMQDDHLFAGTIAENIALFENGFDQCAVETAATIACIHDDILALPLGYQTLVGDMGSSLSGGQRQRIMLARAIYRKPAILVLDEATSHLDSDREQAISRAIRESNATRVLIAHRQETIRTADRIIALEQ